jgi:hypothetical protein
MVIPQIAKQYNFSLEIHYILTYIYVNAQFLLNRGNYHKILYYATINLLSQISAFCILTFGKGKKLSLCMPCWNMWAADSWSHQMLDGSEWLASWRNHCTATECATGTHWREVCVDPRFSKDVSVNRKFSSSYQESNNSLVAQTIALSLTWGNGIL